MSEIIIIAAIAKNYVIGHKGKIPWYIKEDFQHFKKKTYGYPCIMGDITFESLPIKPLPGRENIILTYNKNYNPEGAIVKFSFKEAFEHCKKSEKAFIIGGASIYKQGMKFADTLELTKIERDFEGDTFFPAINLNEWTLIKKIDKIDNKYGVYSFLTYRRIK